MAATDEKILDKIRKLLALSQSPNEHEAASAAERATALLTIHQLTLDDVRVEDVVHADILLYGVQWHVWLLAALTNVHGTRVIMTRELGLGRVIGDPVIVEAVKALYETLQPLMQHYADEGWQQHVTDYTDPLYGVYPSLLEPDAEHEWKHSFLFGMLARLEARLQATRERTVEDYESQESKAYRATHEPQGLMRLEHQLTKVDEHIAGKYDVQPLDPATPVLKSKEGIRQGLFAGDRLPLTAQRRVSGT